MKAMVIRRFGDSSTLEPADIPVPRCGSNELLVRVHAAAVNPIDWKIRRGMHPLLSGRRFPMVLGYDLAGVVQEVGRRVPGFLSGDRVLACSRARTGRAYAEYVTVPATRAVHLPDGLSMTEGAALPGSGCTALQALRDVGHLCPGQFVLIVGASGGVGTFAVQIARAWRAHVTAVCSGRNAELVRELGAHRVIDYESEPVWETAHRYHLVFDAVAAHEFADARPALRADGTYVTTLPNGRRIFQAAWSRLRSGPTARMVFARPNGADLAVLADMAHQSRVRPVIGRVFSLDEVAAAHDLSESGRARGKIVLRVDS